MEVGDDAYERKGERKQDPAGGASDRNADKILGNPLGHSRAKPSVGGVPMGRNVQTPHSAFSLCFKN